MKRLLVGMFAFPGLLAAGSAWSAVKVTGIEFVGTSDPSEVVIQGDGPLTFDKQDNPDLKQVVIEVKDAKLANKGVARKLDTSSFNGNVSLISPYQVDGQEVVRVVIQLREQASLDASVDGNSIRVKIPGGGGGGGGGGDLTAVDAPPADGSAPPADPAAPAPDPAAFTAPSGSGAPSDPIADRLKSFVESQETRKFIGRPITLQLRDADIGDVFRLIGEASGFNILLSDDVSGKVTISLVDVPWDLALDTVLKSNRLGAERNANILRVSTLARLTAEKQEELAAKRAATAAAPKVTRVFSISYAKLDDTTTALQKFASGTDAVIHPDARTNSIVVSDTAEAMEKIRKVLEVLDTQTPQVLIEGKVIDATEDFSKGMNGTLAFGRAGTNSTQFGASFNQVAAGVNNNPVANLIGQPGVFESGALFSAQGATGGVVGFSPRLTFLPGIDRLNAILNFAESESLVRVVSSPKAVVMNKEKASIAHGTPILITTPGGPSAASTSTILTATIGLDVTPTVTNDGSIVLDLELRRDIPTASGIANRNIKTRVVVESGTTLVLGGLQNASVNSSSQGFPLLRKIPIIGALFGGDGETTSNSEIFFFITPRILNAKEAGIST
jgi:type IV pilus assembly protein PilQ